MRVDDFLIDLNDLWGRLVPGLLITFALYLLRAGDPFIAFFTQHPPLSVILVFPLLLGAYILGELCLYPIFKFRNYLKRSPAETYVERSDTTADQELIRFYRSRFSEEALASRGMELFAHCKEFLLQAAPEVHREARRIEARINLKGGVVIPLAALAVLFGVRAQWAPLAASVALGLVFFLGFRESWEKESLFVYRGYYIWHVLHGSGVSQSVQPHNGALHLPAAG